MIADLLERAAAAIEDEALAVDLSPRQWVDCTYDELTEPQKQAVWQMVQATYGGLHGGSPVKNIEELKTPKYRLCMLWDATDDQIPNAFRFYRKTHAGNKMFSGGSDGSSPAKRAAVTKTIELLQTPGWYGELSGRPAEIAESAGIHRIQDEQVVRKVLAEDITWLGDGYYEREMTGVGRHRKALYGLPSI